MPYPRIIHVFDVRLYGSTDSFSSAMDPLFHCRPGFSHTLLIQITTSCLPLSPPTALAFTPLLCFSPSSNSSLFLSRFQHTSIYLFPSSQYRNYLHSFLFLFTLSHPNSQAFDPFLSNTLNPKTPFPTTASILSLKMVYR